MRRKYIPPLLDTFQDVLFVVIGKEKTSKELQEIPINN